jgi:hypothetical protein
VVPIIPVTGEICDEVQLDGTYLDDGWCLLVAINGANGDVIAYQWCDQEKTPAWVALLQRIPAPRVAVIDGGRGLASALAQCWPDTAIQRCLVHVQRNVRTYLTINPRTDAGKTLRALSLALTRIKDRDTARAWEVALHQWHQQHKPLLDQKTFAGQGIIRPTWAKANSTWWWTHERLRKAYNLLAHIIRTGVAFTYLDEQFDGLNISSTTNRIEGGTNRPIKDLLRRHRGMTSEHQRRAVEWWAYLHSTHPKNPWTFARPEHWQPPAPAIVTDDDPIPGDYGTTPTAEEGLWARKGWAGRTR